MRYHRGEGRIYGKPENVSDARRMLTELSGSEHVAMTAFCVVMDRETVADDVVRTRVFMKEIPAGEAEAYLATGEPMDKAGGYGIQGGAAPFIDHIEGSYTNVMGMPVDEVLAVLDRVAPWAVASVS